MKNRVTIKDVAARAGVAYQTVSKVMNGQAQVLPEHVPWPWTDVQAFAQQADPVAICRVYARLALDQLRGWSERLVDHA